MNGKSLPEAAGSGPGSAIDPARLHATRARLRRYATWLDSGIGVPGTRWQIGVEALIGLIPGIGDVAGAVLGSWFVIEAARLRAPRPLLARMVGNVVFDALLGLVPVAGDLADFVFKSNRRNLALLDAHIDARLGVERAPGRPWWHWALLLVALLAAGAWWLHR
ncbi:DUF4112 domain-containing protein [Solimonas marina]|uniref:DUF4112 domain-containing protein n=1 Tax=Solimonas marina TaxID=2714601 RepID=A0A969W4Z6_9GAMM|nr:DUF4112 domain-containing protein [Solimonas marina]NKF20786.1 DUF4112 domain-containing protein [Solimonas marina]